MQEKPRSFPEGLNFLRQDPKKEEFAKLSPFTLLSNLVRSSRAAFFILVRLEGNLRALASSSIEELQEIPFVGPARALQLKSAIQLTYRIQEYCPKRPAISNSFDVYSLCGRSMENLDKEHLRIVLLNVKQIFLGFTTVGMGSLLSVPAGPKEVFRPAVNHPSCSSIILLHNHPSGDPRPSPDDIEATSRLVQAGKLLGIRVRDSILVGHNDYFSFKDEGLIE